MIEIILILMLLFPSMLGLAEILHFIKVYILLSKVKPQKTVLVYLKGKKSVEQLEYVIEEYHWYGEQYAKKIAAIDYGIPDDLIEECKEIAKRNNVLFYSKEFLKE